MRFEDVADTALWVAAYRAIESERPDALFHDPLAGRLAGDRGRAFAKSAVGSENFAWSIVVRTCMLDAWIAEAIAGGVDTVLNLGAGMDTRPYRMKLPASLRWIEVDQARIIDLKDAALADERPTCKLERVKADLARRDERMKVLANVSGNVLALTEGVVGYLTSDAVAALALDLHGSAVGRWIVDRTSKMLRDAMKRRSVKSQFRNAPLLFEPADWETFFADQGWKLREMRYCVEEGTRLGRPVPLPWWFHVARVLMPPARKDELRKMMGFGLLEKT